MKRFLLVLFMVVVAPASAGYKNDVMEPWLGATQDELTAKWGYPQTANDVVKIDDDTTVFTYRSFRNGFGGPSRCVISFTMKKKIVTGYRYDGANCPRHKRNQ
jgi:hypothetical protein